MSSHRNWHFSNFLFTWNYTQTGKKLVIFFPLTFLDSFSTAEWQTVLLLIGDKEEKLGLHLKAYYSERIPSNDMRHHCESFSVEELPHRLQDKWVMKKYFHCDCKDCDFSFVI